jgi:hypothetical protein
MIRYHRCIRGYNERAVLDLFETHITATAARIAQITGLEGVVVRHTVRRLVAKGEISRHSPDGWRVIYFMTERQRWAAFGPTWLGMAA